MQSDDLKRQLRHGHSGCNACGMLLVQVCAEYLSVGVGTSNTLLDGGPSFMRQQALRNSHNLHSQFSRRDNHQGLQCAGLMRFALLLKSSEFLFSVLNGFAEDWEQIG